MTDDEFWALVDAAKDASPDIKHRPVALAKLLIHKSPDALVAFDAIYQAKHREAYRWDLWGAAYVINGGCSDDGFSYFRDWLIAQGRERFEGALADPDSLADVDVTPGTAELQRFGYVPAEVYTLKKRQDMPDVDLPPILEPAGHDWSTAELPTLFPRLAAKMKW